MQRSIKLEKTVSARIGDVAKAARVSASAVSAVMGRPGENSNVRIGPETRKRIIETARQLGYSTNILASGLRQGKTNTIGIILESLLGEINVIKAQAIADMAYARGYSIFFSYHGTQIAREKTVIRELLARQVDGLILFPTNAKDCPHLEQLAGQNFPLVTFYGELPIPVNTVLVDNVHGGWLAVRHMNEIGRTKMAFLGGKLAYHSMQQRYAGWKQACVEAGLRFEDYPYMGGFGECSDEEQGYRLCQNLFNSGYEFNGIVATNDFVALGVLKAIQDRGLRVPVDVAVIGYDDLRFTSYLPVSLTTIKQPAKEVGEAAFSLLLKKMEDPGSGAEKAVLKPTLVIRQSTMVARKS